MGSMFVEGLSALLGQMASWMDGSYGLAVLALAVLVRLALLPVMLGTGERNWHRQRQLQALKPRLERLRRQHANDPAAHAAATLALYREHGIAAGIGGGLLVALVQAPLGMGVYAAIRQGASGAGSFLWIPRLARPDLWLALLVAALGAAAVMLNPMLPEQVRTVLHWLPALISFAMVWHLSAALGLYWLGSGSVNVLQAALLRRRVRRAALA